MLSAELSRHWEEGSSGLAPCLGSHIQPALRADNHGCSCTPQEGVLGLFSTFPRVKMGSAQHSI